VNLNRHTLELVRTRSGLSKADLAERAGVDRTLITRLENGERVATPAVIVKLATALGCSQLALCDAPPETVAS
jgi:transcriptional regulator with XRE-family HTH domain